MKKKILPLLLIVLLLLISIITGCTKQEKNDELKIGKYVIQGTDPEWLSCVILENNNEFIFIRNAYTSYAPNGVYSIESNKLTLIANENESYIFTIDSDKLIFESSENIDALVEKGAVYKLSEE